MISSGTVYHVFEATLPLYAVMALAYLSVKWWRLFTPDQCSGINKLVSKISIPFLSFVVIATNNPYQMNTRLILSDIVQKLLSLLFFAVLSKTYFKGNFDCLITGFAISTLPNTLVLGIPLLEGMYGVEASRMLGQIIVMQSLVWYSLLLFLFELREANKTAVNAIHVTGGNEEPQQIQNKTEGTSIWRRKAAILLTVWKKLMVNPNTYACLAGLVWALVSFRWEVKLPTIINNSIALISNGGLGMAVFSLGLFMASQSKIIACGTRMMLVSLGLRFIAGPALTAIPSYSLRMKGTSLHVAILQAALPQGLVPFVFAKEYGVHPDVLSTGIIVGMIVALPVAIAYYLVLNTH